MTTENTTTSYPVELHTDSSKTSAVDHRLSIIRFKTPSDKKNDATYKKPPTKCVSIPRVAINVTPDCLATALQAAFEELQDEIIRTGVTAGNTTISSEELTPEAVAAWYENKSSSGRLSGESIKAWFDTCLEEKLSLALANAMKIPDEASAEQLAKLEAAVTQHSTFIQSLASPRAALNENLAKQLHKAVSLGDDDAKIKPALLKKLDAFLQPKEQNLEFGL